MIMYNMEYTYFSTQYPEKNYEPSLILNSILMEFIFMINSFSKIEKEDDIQIFISFAKHAINIQKRLNDNCEFSEESISKLNDFYVNKNLI